MTGRTPRLRFKDSDGSEFPKWEEKRLGDLCKLFKGKPISNDLNKQLIDINFLRNNEVKLINQGIEVNKDDLVILVDGENSGEIFKSPVDGYMGSTFMQVLIDDCTIKNFFYYFISKFQEYLRNNKIGTSIPHLNKDLFYSIHYPLPSSLLEQQRVAGLFSALDGRICAAQRKVDALRSMKKGFLQQMFV